MLIALAVLVVGLLGAGAAIAVIRSGEKKTTTAGGPTPSTTPETSPFATGTTRGSATFPQGSTTTSPPLTQVPIGGGTPATTAAPATTFTPSTAAAPTTGAPTTGAPTTGAPTTAAPVTTPATQPPISGGATATTAPSSGLAAPGAGQVPTGGQTARTGAPSALAPGLGLLLLGALARRARRAI